MSKETLVQLTQQLSQSLQCANTQAARFDKLMERFDNLLVVITDSNKTTNHLLKKLEAMTNEVATLKQTIATMEKASNQHPQPSNYSSADIAKMVQNSIIESSMIKEKSHRAVIEKFAEMDHDAATKDSDHQFIKEVVQAIGINSDQLDIDKCHRHGIKKDNKPRVIKVQFNSKDARNQFIYGFRKSLVHFGTVPKSVSVRRDMTPTELTTLYDLRKEAYAKNADCGLLKYFVSDLKIKEIANPKALIAKG